MPSRSSYYLTILKKAALMSLGLSLMIAAAVGTAQANPPSTQSGNLILIEELSFSMNESPADGMIFFADETTILETNDFLHLALSLYKTGKLSPGSNSMSEFKFGKSEDLKTGDFLTLAGGAALPPTQRALIAKVDQGGEGEESYYMVSLKVNNPVLSVISGKPSIDFQPAAYFTVKLKQHETVVFTLPKDSTTKDAFTNLRSSPKREYIALRIKPYQGPPQIFS